MTGLQQARDRLLLEIREKPSLRAMLEYEFLHELEKREEARPVGWIYSNEPDPDGWSDRDITKDRCAACGRLRGSVDVEYEVDGERRTRSEVPDPCLGMLPGVAYACCGHGQRRGVYVVGGGVPGFGLSGPSAARWMREMGGTPPPAAFQLDPVTGAGTTRKAPAA